MLDQYKDAQHTDAEYIAKLRVVYDKLDRPLYTFEEFRDYYLEARALLAALDEEDDSTFEGYRPPGAGGGTEGVTDEAAPHPDNGAPPP